MKTALQLFSTKIWLFSTENKLYLMLCLNCWKIASFRFEINKSQWQNQTEFLWKTWNIYFLKRGCIFIISIYFFANILIPNKYSIAFSAQLEYILDAPTALSAYGDFLCDFCSWRQSIRLHFIAFFIFIFYLNHNFKSKFH
jgi:hypothetical protein